MKNRRLFINIVLSLYLVFLGAASYAVHIYRNDIDAFGDVAKAYTIAGYDLGSEIIAVKTDEYGQSVIDFKDRQIDAVSKRYDEALSTFDRGLNSVNKSVTNTVNAGVGFLIGVFDKENEKQDSWAHRERSGGIINASYDSMRPPPRTLSEIKRRREESMEANYNAIAPAAGPPAWTPEQDSVTAEAVLVPRQVTVISSAQDGRIADIPVGHGDLFKKGDLLIAYDCTDIEAEAEIARIQKDLTRKKAEGTDKLFKLDIISDLDRLGAQVEDRQAAAKSRAYAARMEDCQIRARFDGRVTNRLANPGEYTRTDRVLLEVASNEPLRAEFLIPSKWLRWVNIGAPISITIGETEKTYPARITAIHGEVDPVSQSIQMIATLDAYDDPLLPGMSGQAAISVNAIREAGIKGYLEAGGMVMP
jgi:membrane fusion protein, multidrug efflux system